MTPIDGHGEAPVAEPEGIRVMGSRARRTRPRPRRFGRVVVVVSLLTLPVLGLFGWFWYQMDPWGEPGRAVTLTIPAGEGINGIADRLESRGVIGSALAFRIYTRLSDSRRFEAGEYRLRLDLGVQDAIAALERGPRQHFRRLALAPGLTVEEISVRVGALPGRDESVFRSVAASGVVRSRFQPASVTSLEGLTWPDTYFVADHEDETAILRTIVDAFDAHAREVGLDQVPDPYRAVIVASLIQREAGVDADRALIAAVVENRLRDSMPLQIDATVVYARGGGDAPLTDADFALDSPYNTYRIAALPPTPIATFGAASLRAALHPADVPFKYYVLTNADGRHVFAVTFAEHQANIDDARRRGVLP